ncbi:MAG: hypothetical protein ACK5KR_06060 [Breznakia sp.]
MKKLIVSCLLFAGVVSIGFANASKVEAAQTTVKYGASWSYGSYLVWNGKVGYSNVASSHRWHASTVIMNGISDYSGATRPYKDARAKRRSGYWETVYCYYSIW